MRKQRRTLTGSAKRKKGYHLKGLTKQEAAERTKKGWLTRWKHFGHRPIENRAPIRFMATPRSGGYDPGDQAKRDAERDVREGFRDDERLTDEAAAARTAPEGYAGTGRTGGKRRPMTEQEQQSGEWTTSDTETTAKDPHTGQNISQAEYHRLVFAQEQAHFARFNDFQDPEFRNWLSGQPARVKASFRAGVRREARRARTARLHENIRDLSVAADAGGKRPMEMGDAMYILQHRKQGEIMRDLHRILPDAGAETIRKQRGQWRPPNPTEQVTKGKRKEGPNTREEVLRDRLRKSMRRQFTVEDPAERAMYEFELHNLGVKTHTDKQGRVTHVVDEDLIKVRDEARARMAESDEAKKFVDPNDPIKALKEHLKRRHVQLISEEEQKGLEDTIVNAHFGSREARSAAARVGQEAVRETDPRKQRALIEKAKQIVEDSRTTARLDAEAAINRLAKKADDEWERRQDMAELLERERAIFGGPPGPPGAKSVPAYMQPDHIVRDPRDFTLAEDAYRSGVRMKTGKTDAMGDPIYKYVPLDEVPHGMRAGVQKRKDYLEARARFEVQQKKRGIMGLMSGRAAFGLDERGNLVALRSGRPPQGVALPGPNDHRVAWGVAPNEDWMFPVRDLEHRDPVTGEHDINIKRLERYDRGTVFKLGKRNRWGHLKEGELDELADNPFLVRKYDAPVAFREGSKVPKIGGREPLPKGAEGQREVDEIRYVPVRGATGQEHTADDPSGKQVRRYEVRENNRWRPATREEYRSAVRDWENIVEVRKALESGQTPGVARESRARSVMVPRKIRYKYMDPSKLELEARQADQLSVQIPGFTVAGKRFNERRVFTNLKEGTRREEVIGPYFRERVNLAFERRMERAASAVENRATAEEHLAKMGIPLDPQVTPENYKSNEPIPNIRDMTQTDEFAKHHGFSSSRELRDVAAAAAAAGIYGSRKATRERSKDIFNKSFNTLKKIGPIGRWAERHNWDDEVLTVNRAYLRPLREKRANFIYGLRHPFSDPHGQTLGMDWGRWKYREHWIADETKNARKMGRLTEDVKRVSRTREYVRKHPRGLLSRWRKEPMLRHADYKNFRDKEGFLMQRMHLADKLKNAPVGEDVEFLHPITQEYMKIKSTTQTQSHGRNLSGFIADTFKKDWEESNVFESQQAAHAAKRAQMNWFRRRVPNVSVPGGKTTGIVAGIGLGALAVHYAQHKIRERRKKPEDRVAYYNKILPPAFTTPTLRARTTGRVTIPSNIITREFGFAGHKVPVMWGFSIGRKRHAFRPMDKVDEFGQAYPKNARILGGTRLRGGTKGGKFWKSVIYDADPMKRTYRRGTHDVYIKGKKLPGTFEVGKLTKVQKSRTNPQRMSNFDREEIIWASKGTHDEQDIKNFYSQGEVDRIVEMFDDPDVLRRIERRKGQSFTSRKSLANRYNITGAGGKPGVYSVTEAMSDEGEGFTAYMPRLTDEDIERDYMSQFPHSAGFTFHPPGGGPSQHYGGGASRQPSRGEQMATGGAGSRQSGWRAHEGGMVFTGVDPVTGEKQYGYTPPYTIQDVFDETIQGYRSEKVYHDPAGRRITPREAGDPRSTKDPHGHDLGGKPGPGMAR